MIKGCGETSGTVIIENSKINLDEINLMGLSNPIKPLRTLYGGLNVIKSEFNFGHLKIINSQSEDGVNFINSRVNGEKFYANNIKSDALDSDYSLIDIKNIECRNIFNDCLDTSFSDVFINNLLASDIGDKGISVGEISNVNIKNVYIKNTEIGVAVKDSSKLNLDIYKADSTKLPLAVYIKKKEMGSPVVDIKSFPDELIKESLISNDSQVNLSGTKILGTKKSKTISNMLYGKMYGVKTIR